MVLKQRDKRGQKLGGTRGHSASWEWREVPHDWSLSRLEAWQVDRRLWSMWLPRQHV